MGHFGERRDDGDGDERVLDGEDVGEEACAAAGVVAVEVEGDVREDLKRDERPRRARPSVASRVREQERRREQEERPRIERVAQMNVKTAKRGAERGECAESVLESRVDEVAVLVEAADVRAEAVAEAVGRAVAHGVVRALRRREPTAGDDVLRKKEKGDSGNRDERGGDEIASR